MSVPVPVLRRDRRAIQRMRSVARVAGAVVTLIGVTALASWFRGPVWARSLGGQLETFPNTAVGLVLIGLACVLATSSRRRSRVAVRVLASAAALIGGLTLVEHLTGFDLGIDRLLVPFTGPGVGVASPGRMGPMAAVNLLMIGVALLLGSLRNRATQVVSQTLALSAAPLPLVAVIAYAYDATALYQAARLSAIALPTALALLLADLATLLSRPVGGLMATLVTRGAGSAIARRMLLYAVAIPSALGWAALTLSRARPEAAFTVSLVVVAVTVGMVVLVLRDAVALDRLEAARHAAQAEREGSRKELAWALHREQEARSHAEGASRARDEFLNALSHELRTPLNAILGWTRLLRDAGGDPDRLARGLAVVERNGKVLSDVVSDLLDMSRITRGVIQLERTEVDLISTVEAAVEGVQPGAQARGVSLVRTVDDGVPRVVGDPARLQQVAWNLLSNAVKFTPPGGRVDVRLSAHAGGVVLTVADTGDGIDPEFLPQVFERFRQADGSTTRRHGGLGLGLALTRELVALHGGRVEAESAGKGMGAVFRVYLPPAPGEPASPEAPRTPRLERPHLDEARILVVDDEVDARELLLQLLTSWGARPAGAGSAAEALVAAAAERVDLVVSDIAMPGQDGFAFLQELRRLERALGQLPAPAVALTAYGRPEDRRRVLAGGFDAHLPKPLEPEELRATLSALLRREPRPPTPRSESRDARVVAGPRPVPDDAMGAVRH